MPMDLIRMTIYMIDNVKVIKAHIHAAIDVVCSLHHKGKRDREFGFDCAH